MDDKLIETKLDILIRQIEDQNQEIKSLKNLLYLQPAFSVKEKEQLIQQMNNIHRIVQPVAKVSDKRQERRANLEMSFLSKRNRKSIERV